ncbi:hypothetical protein F8M41_017198 [Gigaspora margarita]|uniref:F-box domain-containing protein n=1 Tax=Gigaspora margarita TaxID=4874 RepID=A0A8H4EUL5_GIGMA|nr:hypothetical protein F8M41_017198 [Gigaspora margarita]
MASKIFMGTMPEIMENILNNLNNEFHSLHSCALVSRHCGATLHTLDLHFSEFLEFSPEIFYSLGENKQFFSQLQNLSLGVISHFNIESVATLLRVLAKNTTSIKSLKLDGFNSDYEPQLLHTLFYALICIIKSQEQLRKFSLVGGEEFPTEFYGIISALESQKNSLQEVIVEYCDYSTEFEILDNCKKLEILRVRYCETKLLKILNYKINTLELVDTSFDASTISAIAQIIEKSGILLQRLIFESIDEIICEKSLLLNALKSHCPNITYLNITNIRISTQLLDLIGNLQNLQFLTLVFVLDIPEEELEIRVMQFAEILPLTLQYLDVGDPWFNSYVDIFFKYCNAPLKKVLIDHLDNEKNTKALIEFCKRNKTLKYVGVNRYFELDKNIRKEVKKYVTLVTYERIIVNF